MRALDKAGLRLLHFRRKTALLILALPSVLSWIGSTGDIEQSFRHTSEAPRPRSQLKPRREFLRVLLAEGFPAASISESSEGPLELSGSPSAILLESPRSGRVVQRGVRIQSAPGRLLTVDGKLLRGDVEAFMNPLGVAVLVNVLPLEDYLRGVVPKELSPRLFPELEALKAQAVAARTFSVSEMGARARLGFDLYSDQRSQVYGGAGSEQALTNRAVDATRGLYLAFQGEPIVAFYSSTCGGVTADYASAFDKPPIEYLKGGVSCPDQESRYARWVEEKDILSIQDSLTRYAGVGKLTRLQILEKTETGRVKEALFEGNSGSAVLRGLTVRYALALRSHFIDKIETRVGKNGTISSVRVEGRGWGHGVGMCQIGAYELARRKMDFQSILGRYYPGAELLQLRQPIK